MSCRIQSISYLCIRQWRPRIYLGIVPRGRFPGRFIIQHLFCLLLTSSRSKASQKHHRLLVLLEVILFSQRCLYLFILVSEIPFPPRAEIDMPSPEPSYQRLRVLVILCPERTCLTTILLCHNYILNKSIQAPHPAPSSGQTQASASASRQKSPSSGKTRTLLPLQFLPVVSSMLSESLSSRYKYTKKYLSTQRCCNTPVTF